MDKQPAPCPPWDTLDCLCLPGFTSGVTNIPRWLLPATSSSEVVASVSGTASGEPVPLDVGFQPTAAPKLVGALDPPQVGIPGRERGQGNHLKSLAWVSGVWES